MKQVLNFLGQEVYISKTKKSCQFLKNLQVPNFSFFYFCNFSVIKTNFGSRREITVFSPDFLRCVDTWNLVLNSRNDILLTKLWLVIVPEQGVLVTALYLHGNQTKHNLHRCFPQRLQRRRRWQSANVSTSFQGSSRERWQVSFSQALCVLPCPQSVTKRRCPSWRQDTITPSVVSVGFATKHLLINLSLGLKFHGSYLTLSFHVTDPDLQMFSPYNLYSYDTTKSQTAPTFSFTFHSTSCCKDPGGFSAMYLPYNKLFHSLSFSSI